MITYRQLVEKTMPPEKKRNARRDIIGYYIYRPIENVLSIPLIMAGIDPTSVTIASMFPVVVAIVVFAVSTSIQDFLVGWLLIFVWNLLDGIDGNIARYCDKTSARGELWDATVGWIAAIAFYEGMGFSAYRLGASNYFEPVFYVFLGCMTAICWIFPRLVMHKKAGIVGIDVTHKFKDLCHENMSLNDVAKLIVFNLISINGIGSVAFLLCVLFGFTTECMIFYFIINFIISVGSLWMLLK